jgi:hypothetical protein
MPPSTPAQCLERAAECERDAAAASSEYVRETLLSLAARWRSLAAQEREPAPPQ